MLRVICIFQGKESLNFTLNMETFLIPTIHVIQKSISGCTTHGPLRCKLEFFLPNASCQLKASKLKQRRNFNHGYYLHITTSIVNILKICLPLDSLNSHLPLNCSVFQYEHKRLIFYTFKLAHFHGILGAVTVSTRKKGVLTLSTLLCL